MNKLYYGDNLPILRNRDYFPSEFVDLIYLDPPFNSARSYNVLFKDESGRHSEAQIKAFDDTWHWGEEAERTYGDLIEDAPVGVAAAIGAMRTMIGDNQMMAYLVMMTARLIELHRVLKPTGALYLHCDPTASHYLKVILDAIFGAEHFLSEIIWKRTSAHSSAKRPGPIHDVILYYSKSSSYTWNKVTTAYDVEYVEKYYRHVDSDGRRFRLSDITGAGVRNGETGQIWRGIDVTAKGRHWMYPPSQLEELVKQGRIHLPTRGSVPSYKRYLDEMEGVALQDVWDDIKPVQAHARELLGYPTQKPVALLERIIAASSNPGDTVLDCFAGCGTAVIAAQKLDRQWIGIDITHLSIALLKYRLADTFSLQEKRDYRVIGEPDDLAGAQTLAAADRYQFQWWALSLIKAKPLGGDGGREGKKGSDRGIDGVITFLDDPTATGKSALGRIIVQVKSGKVNSAHIRDLRGTMEREGAVMSIFITLEEPTREMRTEAVKAGMYRNRTGGGEAEYPRIQILYIGDYFDGRLPSLPVTARSMTLKRAAAVKNNQPRDEQPQLGDILDQADNQ